jgi:parallel beta-helix repeat protein
VFVGFVGIWFYGYHFGKKKGCFGCEHLTTALLRNEGSKMNGLIKSKACLIISIFLLGMACSSAAGRTIYVDDDGPADFNNIQAAIDDANEGDTIIVADGVYAGEGNRDIDFRKSGLPGWPPGPTRAITVRSANGPENCIIDCQGSERDYHRGFYFHSGEDTNSVLDGFTITNGYVDTTSGGGIHCSHSSPTIRNCIIRGNVAPLKRFPWWGLPGSDVIVIIYNTGGGISCYKSSPTITNCYIVGNRVEGSGGGIFLSDSNPIIGNCIIAGNIALRKNFGHGGGIHSNRSSPTITNCTVIENVAEELGGGLYCLLTGSPTITNSIFWSNSPNEIYVSTTAPSTLVVAYSNVQDGWSGEGNIDIDPCFADLGCWDPNGTAEDANDDFWVEGDYHLLRDSYCIDSGDPNYVAEPNETDLDDRPRVINGRIDMGAYEYSPPIQAYVRIFPRTISLASSGKWIAVLLRLPEDYNVTDIEANSIFLENEIEPERFWFSENNQIAIAKFDRDQVRNILSIGQIELTINGWLVDGTVFEGSDVIRVLNKGGGESAKKKK